MALDAGRNTVEIADGKTLVLPVKAATKIYEGGIVMVDGGFAVAGQKAANLITAGRAEEYVDNTGADGDVTIKVRRGVFMYENDTTNPVTESDVLKDCYVLDDETVTILDIDASKAGKILGFEDDQVIVEMI